MRHTDPESGAAATLRQISRGGVVGIVRSDSAETARHQAERAVAAGLGVVEVSLTTPGAIEVIADLTASAPTGTVVGAGTVMTARSAEEVIAAGARIIVTPAYVPEVVDVATAHDVAVVPGCLTPTEMVTAMRRGATAVKIFPAHLWTPGALAGLVQALPDLPCVPTGGIGPDDAASWIAAGAVAVGVGSALTAVEDPGPVVRSLRRSIDAVRDPR